MTELQYVRESKSNMDRGSQYVIGEPVITDKASKQTWILTAETDQLIKAVAAEQLKASGF